MARVLGCLAVATLTIACGGEIREVRPVAIESPLACEAPRASTMLAAAVPSNESASRVVVRADVDAGCVAEALGVVDAPLGDDEPSALATLRANAAKLGADVVLEARRTIDGGIPRMVGTATRCRDVSQRRPYEVLERIDIAGVSGGAAAAFAKLRARAWDLHADLVLDVHLKEDGAELTHVTGTAVRYQ